MSLEQDAKAAAEAEYPVRIHIEGTVVPDPRPPFAHGYQAGHQRGRIERTREIIEFVQQHDHWLAVQIDAVMAERYPGDVEAVETEMRSRS